MTEEDPVDVAITEDAPTREPGDRPALDQPSTDLDATLRRVARECRDTDRPIVVRVQPMLMSPLAASGQNYVGWRGLAWRLSLRNYAQGQQFRKTLDLCFRAMAVAGLAETQRVLQTLVKQED
jgi:hypothetical protein